MEIPLVLKEYEVANQHFQLFEPDREVIITLYQQRVIAFPYWSQVWPAAIALSQFLLQHPPYTAHKNVLELAAGLGLPSFVAAQNAASVITSDYTPEAVVAMEQTIAYNDLQNVQAKLLDWNHLPADLSTDILLLSDVSYDASLFAQQEKIIRQFLAKGTIVIISTPQRLIAKEAIAPLLPFSIHQQEIVITHNGKEVATTVMVLKQH